MSDAPSPEATSSSLREHARLLEERQAELKRANEELKRLDQLRTDSVSMVSHELRTPLATIKEFTAILADGLAGTVTDNQREYLQIIHSNVERMARLIDQLLDSTKLESGQVLLAKHFFEIDALLQQVVKSMEPLAQDKHIRLEAHVPATVGVYADADKLIQVLVNLLSNAIRFTPEQGRVTVTVEELPDVIQFQVVDTGLGIDAEDVPKLFQKFPRLSHVPGGLAGTGLGLAISKRLVELHGGRIWADSQPGRGSTFSFTIPKYHLEEIFREYLKTGLAQAQQRQGHFSIVMVALAEFPALSARVRGEPLTDLLRQVEAMVHETIRRRSGDVIVRWKQGDIIVVLAEVDKTGCAAIAERLTRRIAREPLPIGQDMQQLTATVTSVTYPEDALNAEDFLALAEQRLQGSAQAKVRVLCVDNEPKIRQFLKEILELRGFEVVTAASGPDALERLKIQSVELILLDVMMPVMDGYEVYHLLKENPKTKDIPVIIVTAKGERTDRALGIESGNYNYVLKPFETDELMAKITHVLHRS